MEEVVHGTESTTKGLVGYAGSSKVFILPEYNEKKRATSSVVTVLVHNLQKVVCRCASKTRALQLDKASLTSKGQHHKVSGRGGGGGGVRKKGYFSHTAGCSGKLFL